MNWEDIVTGKASLKDIPESWKNDFGFLHPLCIAAIANDPWEIQYVPYHFVTKDMCLFAVCRDGETLSVIPEAFKSMEICRYAICETPKAYEHCNAGMKKALADFLISTYDGFWLFLVPEEYLTEELCRKAVMSYPKAVDIIPKEMIPGANVPVEIESKVKVIGKDIEGNSHFIGQEGIVADIGKEIMVKLPENVLTWFPAVSLEVLK